MTIEPRFLTVPEVMEIHALGTCPGDGLSFSLLSPENVA